MKIYFSNVNFSSTTGPNTFANRLANQFSKTGHTVVENHMSEYDVFLCFIEPDVKPRPNSRFIHRLDGIWFKPDQFETHNARIKDAYVNCDHVVWQSNFDKNMTTHHWGNRKGTVIHNGIDLSLRDNELENRYTNIQDLKYNLNGRIFVSSASWHRQKRLKENIQFYQKHKKSNDRMLVLGSNPDYIDPKFNDNSIIYTGKLTHNQCLEIYRSADWMIHLAWLDHCPNVVVEALAMGCPVICSSSGGTKEIVGKSGIVVKEDIEYKFELTDYDNPYNLTIPDLDLETIDVNNSHLSIETVAKKYLEIMK